MEMTNRIGQPVVVIGMHRSGTSMLTRFLNNYHIFMGEKVDQNGEAISFLKINEKIMHMCDSTWFNVKKLDKQLYIRQDEFVELYLALIESKKHQKSFFGNNDIDKMENDYSWGWKDPRNTLMIDIIKKIFPRAKIIHIYRNPIDVANSLKVREKKFTSAGKLKWYYNVLKNYLRKGIYVERSPELENLNCGIKLWFEYVDKAFKYDGDIMHIRYENFLDSSDKIFEKICEFLNLEIDQAKIDDICNSINKDRKYSFINDDELVTYYKTIQNDELIKKLNYHKIV